MLYWAAVFFVVSLIAGVFGFTGISAGAAGIAKLFFYGFLVVTVLLVVGGVVTGRKLLKK